MKTASMLAKEAGLSSASELARIVGKNRETIDNWHRKYPKLFEVVLLGAAEKKRRDQQEDFQDLIG